MKINNIKKGKIGVGITTYNSEPYFKALYESLPLTLIDELVVVNGGTPYEGVYKSNWIQHTINKFPSVCRNECIKYLLENGCEHIFIIEDDMVILDENIFNEYIRVSKLTGLKYLCHASFSEGSGPRNARTPRIVIDYPDNTKLAFYPNMCNEFTYHHYSAFEIAGIYDENMREAFDVELAYRESFYNYSSLFWWFADIVDSDKYIMNNPTAVSRLQAERPDGSRQQLLPSIWKYFSKKHGLYVQQIPSLNLDALKKRLKEAYKQK